MREVLKYLAPYKRRMTVGFIIKVSATMIELFIPYILSYILKSIVTKESVGSIVLWGGVMIACAATACVGNIIANRMAARVSSYFAEEMRMELS